MIGYKPYLFDAFYRWCSATRQTPILEFYTKNCTLPPSYLTENDSKDDSQDYSNKNLKKHLEKKHLEKNQGDMIRHLHPSSLLPESEHKKLSLILSPQFCRYLELTNEGVQFWIIPKGQPEPFQVFIPEYSWIHIEAKESGRLQPLEFEERMSPQTINNPAKTPALRLASSDGRLL